MAALMGTWKVIACNPHGNYINSTKLEGILFTLDDNGDVTWDIPDNLKSIPLFSCETYEVFNTVATGTILRFGAYAGHVIEFKCEKSESGIIILACEEWCILHCLKVCDEQVEHFESTRFSFLPALEEGYFSDVIITASNKKQFQVHSCILQLLGNCLNWSSQPPPLSGFPEDVLNAILHFLYCECLPASITENVAKQIIEIASSTPCLKRLSTLCQLFLKNTAFKQQIVSLVNDMHCCANQVIEYFNPKIPHTDLATNPAKFCFINKQCLKEIAIAGVKFVLLCDLFSKMKNELSRSERHEIIRYAKSRLPIFLSQLLQFIKVLTNTLVGMSAAQRRDIAAYLVPEIESHLDVISNLMNEIKSAIEQIIQVFPSTENKSKNGTGDMLTKTLKNVLHIRELIKLKNFHEHITCTLGLLLHKKEKFNDMSGPQKIRSIHRNIDHLIDELPVLLLRLEVFTAGVDDKLEWREFKFCFKVGTSKVSGILQKLLSHRETLQDVMTQISELVQRETFTQSLYTLGLLEVSKNTGQSEEFQQTTRNASPKHSHQLSLVERLCTPLPVPYSALSRLSLNLLKNSTSFDMSFTVINESEDGRKESSFPAHRVVVATRCVWFRRALLSGMKESIDKKIVIYDTSSALFKIFLDYLYSGFIQRGTLNTEQLLELFSMSDRYELEELTKYCEIELKKKIDEESVLYFLGTADQLNSKVLKNSCMNFISHNPDVLDNDVFNELPLPLQKEVYDFIFRGKANGRKIVSEYLMPEISITQSGITEIQNMASSLHLQHPNRVENCSNSSSIEDLSLSHDSERLESCLSQLRAVIGTEIPRERLVQIALAADFDANRAINHYFSQK